MNYEFLYVGFLLACHGQFHVQPLCLLLDECSIQRLTHVGLDVFEYLLTGAQDAHKRYADTQFSEDAQDRFVY